MELHSSSRRGDSRIGRGRGQLDLTLFLEGLRVMAWSYSRDLGGEWGALSCYVKIAANLSGRNPCHLQTQRNGRKEASTLRVPIDKQEGNMKDQRHT